MSSPLPKVIIICCGNRVVSVKHSYIQGSGIQIFLKACICYLSQRKDMNFLAVPISSNLLQSWKSVTEIKRSEAVATFISPPPPPPPPTILFGVTPFLQIFAVMGRRVILIHFFVLHCDLVSCSTVQNLTIYYLLPYN